MARPKNHNAPATSLLISLGISLITLLVAQMLIKELDATQLVSKLLWPLSRLMMFIAIGLLVGQIIEVSGWIKHMAVLARPLFRFGHLGDHCSAAFTTAFFSGVSANAMLLDFFKDNHITRRQLFLTNFVNQLPAFFFAPAHNVFYCYSTYRLGRSPVLFDYFSIGCAANFRIFIVRPPEVAVTGDEYRRCRRQ